MQQFTGKQVKVFDQNWGEIDLTVGEMIESYRFKEANMVVGNIVMGERYCEPQGQSEIRCDTTGDSASIMFKVRGWSTKSKDENSVQAIIKDKTGVECYKITGRYVESLYVEDLRSGEKWSVFNAPAKPQNYDKMFGMNILSLQLGVLSEALQAKLPPTDCRLRPDMRAWELADLKLATEEKNRMENNQRSRRKLVKEILKNAGGQADFSDERTYYTPKFFEKTEQVEGKKTVFTYKPRKSGPNDEASQYLYWQMREQREWPGVPRIYDDDCDPFY